MSIALMNRIKELEDQMSRLSRLDTEEICYQIVAQRAHIEKLQERVTALENRPKPGRPPKNG